MPSSSNPYQAIPSIEELLQREDMQNLVTRAGHDTVRNALRDATARLRAAIRSGDADADSNTAAPADRLAASAADAIALRARSSLVSVYNLTGTVLHTNLGRATLPESAITAMATAAANATTVEFDLVSGKRGDRDDHVESLLCELTGAQAATVINNNAAAVMLCLNSLALNREIPVSRGELIEIGGSFRMPEIMERAGCRLVEVGTTNRTHLSDYAQAIGVQTAALMIVHPSNYEIQGFTRKPSPTEIAALAHEHDIPLIDDLGSGTLIDLERYGLPHEVTVREAINAGADVVTFSGDKLLGGPQAGVIVGQAELIDKIRKNPMKRAMRVDKLTLAALEAVLQLYRNPDSLSQHLPVMRLLSRPLADIADCAQRIAAAMAQLLEPFGRYEVTDCDSQIGSGALPGSGLPSKAVRIAPRVGGGSALNRWSAALRGLPKPVIGRIKEEHLILDVRTLEDEAGFISQLPSLAKCLVRAGADNAE